MPEVLVLQHAEPEGLGTIQDALTAAGVKFRTVRGDLGERIPAGLDGAAGLIVMGGPMGVYEQDRYPFLADELALIQTCLGANVPMLGICLGSQLLAAALGARVRPGSRKEIGWYRVSLTPEAAEDRLFRGVPNPFQGFHWHGDIYDVPEGAVKLASSELTGCQAFRHGSAYGILFHMEVTPASVEAMAQAFPEEMAEGGVSRAMLEQGRAEHLVQLQAVGVQVFGGWVESLRG
jgi:GMP synthase (glutamine-hydrolysing)